MEHVAVDKGFGPIVMQRKGKRRIIRAQFAIIVCCIVLFFLYRTLSGGEKFTPEDFYFITGVACAMIVGEILRRGCLFAEEYFHLKNRYHGSWRAAVEACISVPRGKVVVLVVLVATFGYSLEARSFSFLLYFTVSTVFSLFANLLDIDYTTSVEYSFRNEMFPKNVSAGCAWGYYFGYLKILLPSFPTIFEKARGENFKIDGEDIREKVRDTNLFIVIPKDGYCYKSFSSVDDRISFQHTMPEHRSTRGGVTERVYKNSLYKIQVKGKEPKYAILEYATPLMSVYDMAESAQVMFSSKEKEEEIVQFFVILNRIISNDPECAGKCKFILSGPVATNDHDKERRLADILYDEIE